MSIESGLLFQTETLLVISAMTFEIQHWFWMKCLPLWAEYMCTMPNPQCWLNWTRAWTFSAHLNDPSTGAFDWNEDWFSGLYKTPAQHILQKDQLSECVEAHIIAVWSQRWLQWESKKVYVLLSMIKWKSRNLLVLLFQIACCNLHHVSRIRRISC